MIMDREVKFNADVEYQIVQLMMQSELVTFDCNTIQVEAKEVTSEGIVRFMGSKIDLEQLI